MKLSEGPKRNKGLRAPDVLRHEAPERIEFDPKTDIPPRTKAALVELIQQQEDRQKWDIYAEYLSHFQVLLPEEFYPIAIPLSEVDTNMRDDLALKFLAELTQLGQHMPEFEAKRKTGLLEGFDRDFVHRPGDPNLFSNALKIVQLGWRTLDTVFPDREVAWKRVQAEFEWRAEHTDFEFLARFLVEIKLLFPERQHEFQVTPGQLKRMKQELLAISLDAPAKILSYARAVYLLTADEVRLNNEGQIQAVRKAHLATSPALPPRPLM